MSSVPQTHNFRGTGKTQFCHLCCQSLPQSSMSLGRCQKGGEKVQRKKETQSRSFGLPRFYMFTFTKAKDKITSVDWSHKDMLLQQQAVTALGITAVASSAHFYPHRQGFNSWEVQAENPLNCQPCCLHKRTTDPLQLLATAAIPLEGLQSTRVRN